jgi:regulator of vacuolar morphogenesis
MAAIQGIQIEGHEERTDPKPHVVYCIKVQTHLKPWRVWRRYSEFDDLHAELSKALGPPPAPLPPKHSFSVFRSKTEPALLEERRTTLETYLRSIISSKEDKWREHYAFKDFLGLHVSSHQTNNPSSHFTLSTWLDEYQELQSRLRDVRADINKRETLSDQGDIAASHKSNVSAKQKLSGVRARIAVLQKELTQLAMSGMSEGELQRRTDLVGRLQDDCENLNRMTTVARQSSRLGEVMGGIQPMNPASASDREALMSNKANQPFTRVTRVFGAPSQPQETEATRPLDNHGILGMQQLQMQQQDEQLSQLTTILRRQRYMGEAIGAEITTQNEMLDGLSNDVDQVGDKLKGASQQMRRLG